MRIGEYYGQFNEHMYIHGYFHMYLHCVYACRCLVYVYTCLLYTHAIWLMEFLPVHARLLPLLVTLTPTYAYIHFIRVRTLCCSPERTSVLIETYIQRELHKSLTILNTLSSGEAVCECLGGRDGGCGCEE